MTDSARDDEHWMQRALTLAANGLGRVEPNPMVGAVVCSASGELVGEGWHQQFGGAHAEIHAMKLAGSAAQGGTLFVTLEPCCHWGKTPPCTDAVLRSGVRRVVVAMADPYPKVAGGGLAVLRQAGVQITLGVGGAEARALNAPYLKLIQTGRPWVIAKWAMSMDGRIATRSGESKWISNEDARRKVHELRGRIDAILVGRGTLLADDPLLTARPRGVRLPTRVVVSASGRLPNDRQLLRTISEAPVLVLTGDADEASAWAGAGAEVVELPLTDHAVPVPAILEELGRRRMTNVLVEGGTDLLGHFHDAQAIDEAWVFVSPKLVGGSTAFAPIGGAGVETMAEVASSPTMSIEPLGDTVFLRARFTSAYSS